MRTTILAVAALGCATLSAQFVTPVGYDRHEGSSNNTFPWNNPMFHYMQIHADLGATPRTISGVAFRRDGTFANFAASTARTITLEMFMGNSSLAGVSTTFANNYVGTPTRVIATRPVSAPDWVAQRRTIPAAFDFTIMLDTPYVHTGTNDWAWEVVVTANTGGTATYIGDSATGAGGGTQVGSYVMNGTGCTTAQGEFTLRSNWSTTATTMNLNWQAAGGPASANAAIMIGMVDPNAPFPGLCGDGRLRTIPLVTLFGTTSATGTFNTMTFPFPYNAGNIGGTLHAQGAAADASQPVLPIAVTNGLASTLTDTSPPVRSARIYLSGSTGPVGTISNNFALPVQIR